MINDFYVIRKKYLREYTHQFLDIRTYHDFRFYFKTEALQECIKEFPIILYDVKDDSIEIDRFAFNKISKFFFTRVNYSIFEIKDLLNFLLSENKKYLDETVAFQLIDIFCGPVEKDIKSKYAMVLSGNAFIGFLQAEALRAIVRILQIENLNLKTLQKLQDWFQEFFQKETKREKYYDYYMIEIYKYISTVIENKVLIGVRFDEILQQAKVDDYDKRYILLKNSEMLKHLRNSIFQTKYPELLGITKSIFAEELKSKNAKVFLKKIMHKSETNVFHCDFIKSDVITYDLNVKYGSKTREYSLPFQLSDKNVKNYLTNSYLYFYLNGLLTGLSYMFMIRILMQQNNQKIDRVVKKINKQKEVFNSHSQVDYLDMIIFMVEHNAHKNIIFIIHIANALCLTQKEAWQLSKALGLNNYDSFNNYYADMYTALYSNYALIQ